MRALLSTYDKTGLATFARGLAELEFELVASGGTAGLLEDVGLDVIRVESLTSFPEMLGGRVKTLHPRVHAGILARRDVEEDVRALEEQAIEPFDLVCVNLYPFEAAVAAHGVAEEQAVELIDIGGPAMLRGAAKNFASCAPVCRPEDYEPVLDELRAAGELSADSRRRLATRAFAATAAYEAAIARWFAERETFPETLTLSFDKVLDLEYGENPHQRAAYYGERGLRSQLLSRVEQLHGKPLTFNNLNDLSAARLLLREFKLPACAIVKHANPCGVAVAATIEEAYAKALAADPVSAYGGVVVAQPAGLGRARDLAGRSVRRGSLRAWVRRAGDGGAGQEAVAPRAQRHGAASEHGDGPRLPPCDRRPARTGPRLGRRGARRHGARVRRAHGAAVGRPALRLAGREARRLERDRPRRRSCRRAESAPGR